MYDRNGNGTIDPVEFRYAMKELGLHLKEEELTQMVKYFDRDGNGKITIDEFISALQ